MLNPLNLVCAYIHSDRLLTSKDASSSEFCFLPTATPGTDQQTFWAKCSYHPHPTQVIESAGLFDVVLAVVPLESSWCETGHVALAVLPGGMDKVRCVLDYDLYPCLYEENCQLALNGSEPEKLRMASIIINRFRQWLNIHERWCSSHGTELQACVKDWFSNIIHDLQAFLETQKSPVEEDREV